MLYKKYNRFLEVGSNTCLRCRGHKPVREYFDCYVPLAQHSHPSIGRPPPSTLGSTAAFYTKPATAKRHTIFKYMHNLIFFGFLSFSFPCFLPCLSLLAYYLLLLELASRATPTTT